MLLYSGRWYSFEVEYLTARENSGQDLVLLCGSQYKDHIRRRFFESLQESIEGLLREHVYLVDDVDLVFSDLWRHIGLLYQETNIIYRIVRSGIQFIYIHGSLLIESLARLASPTSFSIRQPLQTVDGTGEDACTRGLSHPTRATKEIGVSCLLLYDGAFECSGQCLLTDHRGKRIGAIFECRYDVFRFHEPSLFA